MNLPESAWRTRPGMRQLLTALDAEGGQTRFVGGAVRDTLLDLPVSDVDLATKLEPGEVIDRLTRAHIKSVPTGIAHGTVTAVLRDGPVEVTTLRRDVSTDGRRATIAYTDDWKEDAARRDFTINALSADPETGKIYDYFDGLGDLRARAVRFIGDPLTRIAEDHLRILRFFRFQARFGAGEPDQAALAACQVRANDLMALSRERIADELLKLLALPDPSATVRLMATRGIFRPVLPEIGSEGLDSLEQLIAQEHAAQVELEPIRRLAALLPPEPETAASVAARLRLSKKASKRLAAAAARAAEPLDEPRALAYRLGRDEAIDRLLLTAEGASPQKVLALDGWERPRLPLSGADLIGCGLTAGPVVARTLQAIERDWIKMGFPQEEDIVRQLAERHVGQALRASQ